MRRKSRDLCVRLKGRGQLSKEFQFGNGSKCGLANRGNTLSQTGVNSTLVKCIFTLNAHVERLKAAENWTTHTPSLKTAS